MISTQHCPATHCTPLRSQAVLGDTLHRNPTTSRSNPGKIYYKSRNTTPSEATRSNAFPCASMHFVAMRCVTTHPRKRGKISIRSNTRHSRVQFGTAMPRIAIPSIHTPDFPGKISLRFDTLQRRSLHFDAQLSVTKQYDAVPRYIHPEVIRGSFYNYGKRKHKHRNTQTTIMEIVS